MQIYETSSHMMSEPYLTFISKGNELVSLATNIHIIPLDYGIAAGVTEVLQALH